MTLAHDIGLTGGAVVILSGDFWGVAGKSSVWVTNSDGSRGPRSSGEEAEFFPELDGLGAAAGS